MIQNYFKGLLDSMPTDNKNSRTITIQTGQGGHALINKAFRQTPMREKLKNLCNVGVIDSDRFYKLMSMLDNDDVEIQKMAEEIITAREFGR